MQAHGGSKHSVDRLSLELDSRKHMDGAAGLAERLLAQLRLIDFRGYESMPASQAVVQMLADPIVKLVRLVHETIRLLRSLPPLAGAGIGVHDNDEPGVDLPGVDLDDLDNESQPNNQTLAIEGDPTPPLDKFCEQMDAYLQPLTPNKANASSYTVFLDVCSHTVTVLKESLVSLRQAQKQQSKWGLITFAEEARRKAQKSLRTAVVLGMRQTASALPESMFLQEDSELQIAKVVRIALLKFRHDILTMLAVVKQIPDNELNQLMRQARIRLLELFGDPHYQDIRAPDRFDMQLLYSRLSDWVDHVWGNFEQARHLLEEVRNYADSLIRVNNRFILQQYDLAVAQTLLQQLAPLQAENPSLNLPQQWQIYQHTLQAAQELVWRKHDIAFLLLPEHDLHTSQKQHLAAHVANLGNALIATQSLLK